MSSKAAVSLTRSRHCPETASCRPNHGDCLNAGMSGNCVAFLNAKHDVFLFVFLADMKDRTDIAIVWSTIDDQL